MDREKVIKGLEGITDYFFDIYRKDADSYKCEKAQEYSDCAIDALALLKEQEAVEPKKVKGYNPPMYTIYEYECEKCKSPMMNKQPFCMGCGRSVKWE